MREKHSSTYSDNSTGQFVATPLIDFCFDIGGPKVCFVLHEVGVGAGDPSEGVGKAESGCSTDGGDEIF